MFEGLVRQLLQGYLGSYVKDFQREQLKITLWNEEVLLENVELILEAFDYLQLPFALREGRVGRLSIRIPWKKLGWDPIIIILEDVFVSASQRDEEEWCPEAVDKREYAAKKAKLVTAELAKLSRRVSANKSGKSFISYITAKILDSIQVSIRNFHILYRDLHYGPQADPVDIILGLQFSSLTIMKQTTSSARGVVSKAVEIAGFAIYCSSSNGSSSLSADSAGDFQSPRNGQHEGNPNNHILEPVDVYVSLLVDRSGSIDVDAPQFSVTSEISDMVIAVDEVQLRQILLIWDKLCISQIREKYGRYRPWSSPLSSKSANWQKLWWRYAQESVLSDVRRSLKKSSWRSFGERLSYRRQYVDLYKQKLLFLRQDQSVEENIIQQLEQMEKESDIDDIINYRSVAEHELEELVVTPTDGDSALNGLEKSRNSEQSSIRPRGWLNWLSRGMLGAGGTEDSSQFSGVVSDEVIKDIYEATEFQPPPLINGAGATDRLCRCGVKFSIHDTSATFRSMKSGNDIAKFLFKEASVEYKIWDESSSIITVINSIEVTYPQYEKVILLMQKDTLSPSCRIQVDLTSSQDVQVSLEIAIEPLRVSYDSEFFMNIMTFYDVLQSVEFQHKRVVSSLNGIRSNSARLLSKSEYVLSTRGRIAWDININDILISVPWTNSTVESEMVLGFEAFAITSNFGQDDQSSYHNEFVVSNAEQLQLQDLYDHFSVKVTDFQVEIVGALYHQPLSVLEKFSANLSLAFCIIPDESIDSIPTQLEVNITASSFLVHFSPSIYAAAMGLISYLDGAHQKFGSVSHRSSSPDDELLHHASNTLLGFSLTANLDQAEIHVDFENGVNSTSCMLSMSEIDARCKFTDLSNCWLSTKAIKIICYPQKDKRDALTLCLFGPTLATNSGDRSDDTGRETFLVDEKNDRDKVLECLLVRYEASRCSDSGPSRCMINLNNGDLHCYPFVISLLVRLFDQLAKYDRPEAENSSIHLEDERTPLDVADFGNRQFGFSNFLEPGVSQCPSVSLDHFPFVSVRNSGCLTSLESSLLYFPDWRKHVKTRQRKPRNKSTIKDEVISCLSSSLKSTLDKNAFPVLETEDSELFHFDFDLHGIRVHFHDHSCTVGIIALPIVQSTALISNDSMDIMCSSEGLVLTSSWWTQRLHDFLWGPSSDDYPPILNVRVRNQKSSVNPQTEVSIGIQHVRCILPPEYLAILIGYFSLPDWMPDLLEQFEENRHVDGDKQDLLIYKVEVLDSDLFVPTEIGGFQFLKVDIPQLHLSFILDSLNGLLESIPAACTVQENKVAKRSDCLNLFGRKLSLSLLMLKDEGTSLPLAQEAGISCFKLIASLDADVWVRIPVSAPDSFVIPTCIMGKINHCELVVNDRYLSHGLEALSSAIDEVSSVSDKSKGYTGDMLQPLGAIMSHEIGSSLPNDSKSAHTEVLLSANLLTVKLNKSMQDSMIVESVANAEMQFTCSVSLENDIPQSLKLTFTSFALHSAYNSLILATCSATCFTTTVLDITFSVVDLLKNEVSIFLPSLEIWLELTDWMKVLDAVNFVGGEGKTVDIGPPSSATVASISHNGESAYGTLSLALPDNTSISEKAEDSSMLVLRFENMGIMCHCPFPLQNQGESVFQQAGHPDVSPDVLVGKHCKFVSVSMSSRSTELFLTERSSRIKTCVEKITADVAVREEKSLSSWPLFQIVEVTLEAEVCNNQTEIVHVATEMQCDHVDVSLSHQVFSFWHDIELNFPEGGSSQFSVGSIDCRLNFRKVSILVTDGRLRCSGPLLEVLLRNFIIHAKASKTLLESSVASDLQVNYNNIHKVTWEPFIEPWNFLITITRKREISVLLKSSIVTELYLKSVAQLNLNVTESFFECVCRTTEMMKDALGLTRSNGIPKSSTFFNPLVTQSIPTGRDAPYVIQNLTSLSLAYCTFLGPANLNEFPHKDLKDWSYVEPSSSTPIFISQTPEEQLLRFRPASSSDRLNENQSNGTSHRYIIIQLDGTSSASEPISMDLVGVSYFEVDFSKASTGERLERTRSTSRLMSNPEERANAGKGFVVPVVFDVSVQRFSKLIKLYSTVIVLNETPMPLELRFDIPFSVSPKVLDPVNPSQQFPLPLHLAESGRVGLRPQGNSYVWSEAHNLRTVLSQDSKSGFLRSFVCYPSHLRGDPFRCCISVKRISLPSLAKSKNEVSKRFLYQLALSTPLVIHNYLPEAVSLIIECGGVKRPTLLSEVDTSFHQIDPSHDMGLEFHMPGYKLAVSRFPHAETFRTSAKFSGTNFTVSEILVLDPDTANGPIHVTLEKRMDAFSGARELFIYVPFLLYNCLGFALDISDSASELTDSVYTMTSCYDLVEEDLAQAKKDGLSLISSNQDKIGVASRIYSHQHHTPNGSMVSSRIVKGLPLIAPSSSRVKSYQGYLEDESTTSDKRRHLINLPELRDSNMLDEGHARVRAFSYSPCFSSHAGDNMVRVRRHLPELGRGIQQRVAWSDPFPLDPASGSISILVPQAIQNAAYVVSVTSSALSEPFSGRTRAISFQPRFVISNACGRELCYKQKGTDSVFYLGVGQHTTLQWTDTKRDLLVSICYSEPGWQWSGSFLPDLLGDTQLKMRNYISGALNMIRVEVQYADVSIRDEQIVASLRGNSGTNLILLSDDDSGYMPYRVENFSKERLRIYQLRCENFETILHSYQSCPYAWDEPCYPHRLVLEVPGERVLGSYALDDVNESMNVHLPATSEKPERMLLVSVHAEGATKVLRVVDSSYHVYKDMKDPGTSSTAKKNKPQQKRQSFSDYNEKVSISIPYVGISLINSIPQELLFACAKGLTIDILQSVDQQKVSFQLSSLQIDNLLRTEQYPVILSFDGECSGRSKDHGDGYQNKCEELQIHSDSSCHSVICLAVGKWRKKDVSLISFEYIILRVAEFHLELEQEVASHVSELLRTIYLRFDSGGLPVIDPKVAPFFYDMVPLEEDSRPPQPDLRRSMANGGLGNCLALPSVIPIGAPWQQFCHLARRQKKIYVELFDLAPIKFSLSFCSSPWMVGFGIPLSGESLMHRGLMALADIEGARIYLKQLTISHQMAGWESIQEILLRHYSRQLLHEMYKVLGSAGVIGNPMGFARSLGLGIKDFVSVPTTHILQSPAGLVRGMAKGTTSLLSSTVYALSDATSQFTKAAQKGIVALTFDEQAAARMEQQQRGAGSSSQGVINEVLEGLTGLLQSPIRGAEKHGLPGVLSGMAMGLTGLVARPAASILEVTGKTAQSIRNRSKHHHQMGGKRLRVRLPRPLKPHLPLTPYSWEEAIGTCVLVEAAANSHTSSSSSSGVSNTNLIISTNKGDLQEEDQVLVSCKALKEAGKFVVITHRLIIVVNCSSLVDFDKPDFQGIPANPDWVIESEIYIDSVIHCDADENTVHIVGSASSSDGLLLRQKHQQYKLKGRKWQTPTTLPLFQTDLELASPEDAQLLLSILLSTIEHGKEGRWGTSHVIHRTNIR